MVKNKNFVIAGVFILTGLLVGILLTINLNVTTVTRSNPQTGSKSQVVLGSQEKIPEALLHLQNIEDAFVYVAESVVPTVVTIHSRKIIRSADFDRYHNSPELRDFFRFKHPKDFRQEGSGSGIIVSKDGYILTNVHVVDASDDIRVTLYDNREFEARIVGMDPLTEVAVIKIDADELPVARLGNSDQCKVGQWVLAIGNPLELKSTVTAGIISALQRQINIIKDDYGVENFLQTDAAINPGNSGGPLVNLKGEVIGVNTAIATETGYNAGFGFAIPINLAKKIMSDLIFKGKVERGFLGIAMKNMDVKKARALGLKKPMGVFIDRVFEDSPAHKAGVRPKDVLIAIDDQEVYQTNQVQSIIATKNPGEKVHLTIIRKAQKIKLPVILGKKEINGLSFEPKKNQRKFKNLGLHVKNLTREDAVNLNYSGRSGVLVTEVEKWSPAYDAGIRENEIITEIDDYPIKNKEDFEEVISNLKTNSVSIFTIISGGDKTHFFVEVTEK